MLQLVNDGFGVGIVNIDYSAIQLRVQEQPRLGGSIGREVTVVIEMIATEVCKQCGAEMNPIDAALVQRVRGHFHRHMGRSQSTQFSQPPVHTGVTEMNVRAERTTEPGAMPTVPSALSMIAGAPPATAVP